MSPWINDGTCAAPRLRVFLNLDNLVDLRADTIWPAGLAGEARDARLVADGFEGVQLTEPAPSASSTALPYCGLARINTPAEADIVAARHRARGDLCLTVHAGWGLEDERETFALVEALLAAATKHRLPIFLETHRATITQDLWRTVQIVRRYPEIRFNGDFSHYYCGQEMPYGGLERKLEFMAPLLERTGFLHGRVASPGSMQVPISADLTSRPPAAHGLANYLADFREIWTRAMAGFLSRAGPGDQLIFAPELLSGTYYYARLFPDATGQLVEETDRYAQALIYRDLARACFADARARQQPIPIT